MARDFIFPVREEVVAFLRASGPLTALIAAKSIYGQMQPPNSPYPFVRFGQPSAVPLEYACQDGSTILADLHVFAENEDEAAAIASELVTTLDAQRIQITGGGSFDCRWTAGQSLRDPVEPDIWHETRTFEFEAGR